MGEAYRKLIHDWTYVLPAQSICLAVPVITPKGTDEPFAVRRRQMMANLLRNSRLVSEKGPPDLRL